MNLALQTKKPKPNRRTLRKRIRRTFFFSSFINVVIFGIIILLLMAFAFNPIARMATGFIGSNIANDMSSQTFLQMHHIESLRDFDPDSPSVEGWKRHLSSITEFTGYWNFITNSPPDRKEGNAPPGNAPNPGAERLEEDAAMSDFVIVDIHLNGQQIYTNASNTSDSYIVSGPIGTLFKSYTMESQKPIMDENGVQIGYVSVHLAEETALAVISLMIIAFVALILFSLILNHFLGTLLTLPLIKPLTQLETNFKLLAAGDYDATSNTQLQIKRPLREIESITVSTNRIMQTMKDYAEELERKKETVEEQFDELEAQNDELLKSKQLIQEAQAKLEVRERALRNLLDNAGQGFLTFGTDLLIHENYSLECARMFGSDLGGYSVTELISLGDEEQQKFLTNIFTKIFEEKDAHKRAIYFPLLIDEISCQERTIQVDYKLIRDPDSVHADGHVMMAILTDITETRALRLQMEEERNVLNMVVKVVSQYNDFMECVRDYRQFCAEEINSLLSRKETAVQDILLELYRELHTYKGNFSQIGMIRVVRSLHEAETAITQLRKSDGRLTMEQLRDWVMKQRMDTWLDEDMNMLKQYLGEAFFQQKDVLLIDKSRLLEIERKMLAVLSPAEYRMLLPEVRKLRYKSFKDLLKSYPEYTVELAARFEKGIHPFHVEGEDFLADTARYYDFSRSLIHLYRNIVDHGMEPAEQRQARGKDEFGTVQTRLSLENGRIVIEISDDGGGIDVDQIREAAVERGLLTREQATAASSQQFIDFVFHPNLTTKTQVTDISGRGIGLSSVKAETEKLGGSVQVSSEPGAGTVFRFELPFEQTQELPRLDIDQALQPIIGNTKAFFDNAFTYLSSNESFERLPVDKLALRAVTTFVNIRGALEGTFVLSIDEALSRMVAKHFLIGDATEDELSSYIEDSLAESANIILGNSMKTFEGYEDYILMDPPVTLFTEGASVRYAQSDIFHSLLSTEQGEISIGFVLSKKSY